MAALKVDFNHHGTHFKNRRMDILNTFRAKTAQPDEGMVGSISRGDGRFAAEKDWKILVAYI